MTILDKEIPLPPGKYECSLISYTEKELEYTIEYDWWETVVFLKYKIISGEFIHRNIFVPIYSNNMFYRAMLAHEFPAKNVTIKHIFDSMIGCTTMIEIYYRKYIFRNSYSTSYVLPNDREKEIQKNS